MENASMNKARWLRRLLGGPFLVAAGLLCAAATVHAEPSPDDKALATMLFQEGRALMLEGRTGEACQKLEESERLHAAGGTILNLALCHEQEGRLARSWGEFNEALSVARRDGRRDREVEAANHIRDLEPRLSRLTIVVPPAAEVPGLTIERDGHEIGRGAWSTPIPVDGGEHVVRATATGREPFVAVIVLGKESDARTVEITVLAATVPPVRPLAISAPAAVATPQTAVFTPARLRLAGIATAGVGVVLLGTAGYALAKALSAKDASNSDCFVDGCNDTGLQRRNEAVSRGNLATILGVSGAMLVGAGAALFYVGRRSSAPRGEARLTARLMLGAAGGSVATGIAGDF